MTESVDEQFNPETGRYEPAIPLPYYHRPGAWLWRRLTNRRDEHGRKAQLLLPIRDWFRPDI